VTNYIGIDIGTELLGWAALNEAGEYISSGWVDLETTLSRKLRDWNSLEIRLKNLCRWALEFFGEYERVLSIKEVLGDTLVGIEHPWVGQSRQTALTLGIAWGIIAQAAMQCGLTITKVGPTRAKKAMTGSGKATKDAMLDAAKLMGAKCDGKGQYDEADALGVALATRLWALERERESL